MSLNNIQNIDQYELSDNQKNLWLVANKSPEKFYNQIVFNLNSGIELNKLISIIHTIIERHKILTFKLNKDVKYLYPFQYSSPENIIDYKEINQDDVDNNNSIDEILDDSYNPFEDQPLRFCFLKKGDMVISVVLRMYSFWSDSYSLSLFCSEFSQSIDSEALLDDDDDQISYTGFATWQNELFEVPEKEAERFWKDYRNQIGKTEIPFSTGINTDFSPSKIKLKIIEGQDYSDIKEYCLLNNVEISDFLLQKFECYISRFSHNEVILGYNSHKRSYDELNNTFGYVSKSIPLKINLTKEESKLSDISTLRNQIEDVKDWGDYFSLNRNENSNDVKFNYCFEFIDNLEFNNIKITDISSIQDPFDVKISCIDYGDQIEIQLYYNELCFPKNDIVIIVEQLRSLFSEVTEIALRDFKISDLEEKIIGDSNNTSIITSNNHSIIEVLNEQLNISNNNVALVMDNTKITYKDLHYKSNQFKNYLIHKCNVMKGDAICILGSRSDSFVTSMLGVLKASAYYIPIDLDYPRNRIEFIIEESQCKLLICDEDLVEDYSFLDVEILSSSNNNLYNHELEDVVISINKNDPAYCIYTSGSTGNPKGCVISHGNLINYIEWANSFYFENNDFGNWGLITSISFDLTITSIFSSLTMGKKLWIGNQKMEIKNLLTSALDNKDVDTLKLTPSHLSLIKELNIEEIDINILICGGEQLTRSQIDGIWNIKNDILIYNEYGPTEATVGCIANKLTKSDATIAIGKPVANTKIDIVSENGVICPIGAIGEILISGKQVSQGYLNNPDLTKQKFKASLSNKQELSYQTGDLGRWLSDGSIEYIGRLDNQIKIRGYRVELGEIESSIQTAEEISSAIVLTKINQDGNNDLVAFIKSDIEVDIKDLKKYLSERLPGYMIPTLFYQLEEFPLTINGKVDTKALLKTASISHNNRAIYEEPKNEIEATLVRTWEDILKIKKIGTNDDFFKLGGQSIKAIRLINEYQEIFHVKLLLKDVFEKPILSEHAKLISNSCKTNFIQIEKAPLQASYPISYGQRRLWILSQFNNGSAAYNIPYWFKLKEEYDKKALEKAILKTIERHEILRTQFKINEEGAVRQYIMDIEEIDFELTYKDFTNNSEQALSYITEDLFKAFNLENEMLLRAALLQISENEYYFYFNMHHIVSDGWSMEVLSKDVLAYYEAYRYDKELSLKKLPIQYKDYASWQLSQVESDDYSKSKQYWLEKLSGELPKINLPNSKVRPNVRTYKGRGLSTFIDKDSTSLIKKHALSNDGSIYISLLSTLLVLLHRYTSDKDIIIGTPMAARDHFDLKDQIGFYVNTIALRNNIDTDVSFSQFYNQIRKSTLEGYGHQMYPFDRLIEEMSLIKDTSRHPIFDIMLILQNNRENNYSMNSLDQENIDLVKEYSNVASKFDLEIIFEEVGDYLSFSINYNADIYTSESIREMMFHFKTLIQSLFENPENIIGSVNFLSKKEEALLLKDFNDTVIDYSENRTILDYFEDQVQLRPNEIAIDFEGKELTYIEVDEISSQLAHYLINEYSVVKEDIIAVKLERSEWMVLSILGILKSGAAYAPIAPDYPQNRISYIKEDTGCKVCIDLDELNKFNKENYPKTRPEIAISENDLAYVIYTSGSTGTPKGVLIEHQGMMNRFLWMIKDLDINSDDVFLQKTPYTFDVSVWELLLPFMCGSKLVIAKPEGHKSPDYIESIIINKGITIIHFVPSMLKIAIEMITWNEVIKLRHVVCSGEAMSVQLENEFKEVYSKADLHNYYGPTEASIDVTKVNLTQNPSKETLVSIGKPVDNTEIFIVNEQLALQPLGVPGEILIGGVQLAREYLNKEDLTHQKFIISPFDKNKRLYRSGDIGRFLPDGSIQYIGRKDNQIKIRGNRVELGEIEKAIYDFDLIDQVVVTVKEKPNEDKELVAFFISKEKVDVRKLISYLKNLLPYYMIPSYLIQVDEIPLNLNGKVDTKQLLKLSDNYKDEVTNYVAPTNEVEEQLVVIVENILGHRDVGVEDDFFLLGGDSIKLIRLRNEILSSFEIKIGIEDLFTLRNIKEVADYILNLQWNIAEQEKEDVEGVSFTI